MSERRRFHTVIVCGGTAGCVLANRLSERPDRSVALIEAGPDFGPAAGPNWPPELAIANFTVTSYDWGDLAGAAGYAIPYARGIRSRGDRPVHINERFLDRGWAVLTASNALEYACECRRPWQPGSVPLRYCW